MSGWDILDSAIKKRNEHPELRLGQAVMTELYNFNPRLYSEAIDAGFDCFYTTDPDRVFQTLLFVHHTLTQTPNEYQPDQH